MLGLIISRNGFSFSDEDLPPEGHKHDQSLNKRVLCKKHRVPLVLIDKGSGLNVCPLRTAMRLGQKAPHHLGRQPWEPHPSKGL